MPVELPGATLKRFFDDPAVWPGPAAYEDLVLLIDGTPDACVDPLAIPDRAVCCVQGGWYLAGDGDRTPLTERLERWLGELPSVRLTGTFDRAQGLALRARLAAEGWALDLELCERPTVA